MTWDGYVNRCCMRLRDVESVAHLSIHCPAVKDLWYKVLNPVSYQPACTQFV